MTEQLEEWLDATGVDGFNLTYAVTPDDLEAVVDLLVAELQRRGRYRYGYEAGSLRHKLFGEGGPAGRGAHWPAAEHRVGGGRLRLDSFAGTSGTDSMPHPRVLALWPQDHAGFTPRELPGRVHFVKLHVVPKPSSACERQSARHQTSLTALPRSPMAV